MHQDMFSSSPVVIAHGRTDGAILVEAFHGFEGT
jgi:hypothetical protein